MCAHRQRQHAPSGGPRHTAGRVVVYVSRSPPPRGYPPSGPCRRLTWRPSPSGAGVCRLTGSTPRDPSGVQTGRHGHGPHVRVNQRPMVCGTDRSRSCDGQGCPQSAVLPSGIPTCDQDRLCQIRCRQAIVHIPPAGPWRAGTAAIGVFVHGCRRGRVPDRAGAAADRSRRSPGPGQLARYRRHHAGNPRLLQTGSRLRGVVAAILNAKAQFSITARIDKAVQQAISSIPEDAWIHQVTAWLIVRRCIQAQSDTLHF